MSYNPHKIEKKWQEIWEKEKPFSFSDPSTSSGQGRPKFYILDMFPYPSGEGLHVGHPEGYTATDIIARYQRMRGFNVLHPMGWDAFGLPAENYAIKTGVHPAETTKKSINTFKRQIKRLGFSYDWSRELSTADPEYYKWTQWLFLYLYKKGLAYQKEAPVNWCSSCNTVLANEQVVSGECERCGTEVVQKNLKQWFFKITDYTERLLDGLEEVDWPEKIKTMQKNWIGKSEGVELEFRIKNQELSIKTFTTRPDTLFGATYLVLAPEHELVDQLISLSVNQEEIKDYIKQALKKTELERVSGEKEKTGVELKGVKAVNPANKEETPVFIADYVLGGYGTGAIMAVPAHDERDFEFAKKFDLPIIEVIKVSEKTLDVKESEEGKTPRVKELASRAYIGEGFLINSDQFNGMPSKEARGKITEFVKGEKKIQYKLRDWLISRQRYWGAPIPIIYCEKCGTVPVPEEDLPVELPIDVDFKKVSGSLLKENNEFVNVKCSQCGGEAKRETDTMDGFVDNSWYYYRYIDPKNNEEIFDKNKTKKVMPIDLYVGGAEHAVGHLMYSRFITKVLADGKVVNFEEPFLKLKNQGLILGEGSQKMSKSRGNVINPDNVIEEYGADAFRMYEMFMGPFEDAKPWDTKGIIGVFRFLVKVWNLGEEISKQSVEVGHESEELRRKVHQTIYKVENDIVSFRFNTAISAMMILLNSIEKEASHFAFRTLLLILYPFAPYITSELWEKLGYGNYIWEENWPETIEKYLQNEEVKIIVQINGRLRDTVVLPTGVSKDELEKTARGLENTAKHLADKKVKDVIVVPDKLVNFVTE